MRIRRLRTRIILFFVALLALVQIAALALVNLANLHNAHVKATDDLAVGERVFGRLVEQRAHELGQAARVLASDFAFREAVATGDAATINSALANHGSRIGAAGMLFVGPDGHVVGDTLTRSSVPRSFEYPALLESPPTRGSTIEWLGGRALQLVVAPVLSPLPIGWVVVGVPVDDGFARDLRQLTSLEVSFLLEDDAGRWRSLASTLPGTERQLLLDHMAKWPADAETDIVRAGGDDLQARMITLDRVGGGRVVAILDRSLANALASFEKLRATLITLAAASLLVSIGGSIAIAANITRPLSELAEAASRIEHGDYSEGGEVPRADEIGRLASSLNHMRAGISERETRILRLAYRDTLTDLANRSKFAEELAAAIDEAASSGTGVAILVMDLDRFKCVNDILGYSVGDHVLQEVGNQLLREAPDSACIARLGGDEFALLLRGAASMRAADTARAINKSLEQPILYRGQPLDVGASIGLARYPEHGHDASTLIRNADIAMYVAKRNRSGLAVYDPEYDSTQRQHLSLLSELRQAIDGKELRLHYQPKVSLSSGTVSAVEALLRWHHPQRGMVSPAEFIPFAEHTGYIKVLTRWVLEEAIRQCAEWLREGIRLQISVNISARDLMNRDLPEAISELLRLHGVAPALLCLEITESGFMEDPAHAQKVLDRLHALGLKLSIDDYGTGYSSLSYIMKLPVQELKIDRSFISRMVADSDISTIVRSTIDLGHSLGLNVVAEGVEDLESWNLLARLGCDDVQGYYMSPPLEASALKSWIRDYHGRAAAEPASGNEARRVS